MLNSSEAAGHLCQALKTVCPNVERLQFTGKADQFITFQILTGSEKGYAGDEPEGAEILCRFDVYARGDPTGLVGQAIEAARADGFYGVTVDPEVYETDTGFYHVPVTLYWEV